MSSFSFPHSLIAAGRFGSFPVLRACKALQEPAVNSDFSQRKLVLQVEK